jgi:hypothetical protein
LRLALAAVCWGHLSGLVLWFCFGVCVCCVCVLTILGQSAPGTRYRLIVAQLALALPNVFVQGLYTPV